MPVTIKQAIKGLSVALTLTTLVACTKNPTQDVSVTAKNTPPHANPELWPVAHSKVKRDQKVESKIEEILGGLTLKQKVAQLVQPEIRAITVEDMREYGFGSYLNGGGAFPNNDKYATMADWVALADDLYHASVDDSIDGTTIPTMWGTDAVHGHNNVIGATLFPHNIGLGAMNNPDVMRQIGSATAKVVAVTGIDWVFAPTVAVVRDDRWGRTYEGYAETPEITTVYATAMVEGLQGKAGDDFLEDHRVIATAKHFLGDGGTVKGDDQGNNIADEEEYRDLNVPPYVAAIDAGVQTIMASFNSWKGEKMHGNSSMLTAVLKDRMGFDGLIVGDWDGHGQVDGCDNGSCAQAINAGVDIIMVPNDWKAFFNNTVDQVKSGEISMERLDDAVSRILRVKIRAGLFKKGAPSTRAFASKQEFIGSPEHRAIARQAVRESLVLLKNKQGLLPLERKLNVLVTGGSANSIGKASGGWSITWQGTGNMNKDFPGATSIYAGIDQVVTEAGGKTELSGDDYYKTKPDVAIVVFGESTYAEGEGDISNLEFERGDKRSLAILQALKAKGIPVVSVFISGRPMWVNAELNASDAFVAAWLPGTEGQGISDVLFKNAKSKTNHDFKGKLSFSWPRFDTQSTVNVNDEDYNPLFPYGFGLTYRSKDTLAGNLSEVAKDPYISAGEKLVIFRNRPVEGSDLFIGKDREVGKRMTSSIEVLDSAETLVVRAVNWEVQEDARELTWSGKGMANGTLRYEAPQDHSRLVNSGGVLSVDVRMTELPKGSVMLSVSCGEGCQGEIDISGELINTGIGPWDNLTIDVQCFVQAGADFSRIDAPFGIRADSAMTLAFANVEYLPGSVEHADMICSNTD
ncbi:MAG: beta-glucosidase [Alteromonadaceae bacterium]|nr:MAG: beta-glucosidase [Alteromonadaceae bacterium]